jgi:hypothetical protein
MGEGVTSELVQCEQSPRQEVWKGTVATVMGEIVTSELVQCEQSPGQEVWKGTVATVMGEGVHTCLPLARFGRNALTSKRLLGCA